MHQDLLLLLLLLAVAAVSAAATAAAAAATAAAVAAATAAALAAAAVAFAAGESCSHHPLLQSLSEPNHYSPTTPFIPPPNLSHPAPRQQEDYCIITVYLQEDYRICTHTKESFPYINSTGNFAQKSSPSPWRARPPEWGLVVVVLFGVRVHELAWIGRCPAHEIQSARGRESSMSAWLEPKSAGGFSRPPLPEPPGGCVSIGLGPTRGAGPTHSSEG